MNGLGRGFAAIAALAFAMQASQAAGQAWIGQIVGNMASQQQAAANEAACMRGEPPSEIERVEALGPADAQLRAYHAAMQASSTPRSTFFALDKKAAWTHGETRLKLANIDSEPDPFAAHGLVLDAEPLAFYRSYIDAAALGQWAVRDVDRSVVGVYNAFFVRKLGAWKIRTLSLEDAAEYSGPADQFCHAPGDVLPYRIENAELRQDFHGPRVAKAEAKLAQAVAAMSKAEAALGSKPGNSAAVQKVETARAQLRKWEGEVAERRAQLDNAQADLRQALADKAEVPEKLAKARLALGITSGS